MPRLGLLLKVAVAAALVWYVVGQVQWRDELALPVVVDGEQPVLVGHFEGDWKSDHWTFVAESGRRLDASQMPAAELRPGFLTTLRSMDPAWFAGGFLAWGALLLLSAMRWRLLLGAAELTIPLRRAWRLTLVGTFFNNVMFGATGGDLVRAVLVTRGLDQHRWRAALSVLVDRVVGLFVLLLIAEGMLLVAWADGMFASMPMLRRMLYALTLLLLAVVLGASAYLSRRMRRLLRVDAILARFPEDGAIRKMDAALTLYRLRPRELFGALLLSVPLQTCGILSFWAFALALGADLDAFQAAIVFPLVQTASAVPVAPAGWGVGETLYGWFFDRFGVGFTLGVAVSVLFRLATQVGWGLVGGFAWVLGHDRLAAEGEPVPTPPASPS